MQNPEQWTYRVNKWFGHPHYYVTIYPSLGGSLLFEDVFKPRAGVDHSQKFNSPDEVARFVKSVRRKLNHHNIKLKLRYKNLAL